MHFHKKGFSDPPLAFVSTAPKLFIVLNYLKGRAMEAHSDLIALAAFISVKAARAIGNQLTRFNAKAIRPIAVKVGAEGQ